MKCQKCNGEMETGFIPDYGYMTSIAEDMQIDFFTHQRFILEGCLLLVVSFQS